MDDALRWQMPRNPLGTAEPTARTHATARFGGDNDEPVLVAVITGPIESEMARDALAEAGVPALVKRKAFEGVYGLGFGAFGSAEVWTPPACVEQARDVLIGIGLLAEDDER